VFISHFLLERSLEVLRIPRATVIANPYDDTLFSAFPFNASLNDGQRPIAFVGRLVEIKGVDTFLEGYASAVKAGLQRRLHIVGDGPLRSPLLARADRLGIAHLVEWQGFLYGEELVRQYQEAVAVVVPSQWEEPFGLVAAEAMGCGTRVLVSNRGALPEVVARPEWCVQPTPQGWADALFSLREPSFSERQTLSAETQRRFGQMSQAKVYADLLTKVVPS
jgi:glycosyltransferase involved in cell wall biosynthesis